MREENDVTGEAMQAANFKEPEKKQFPCGAKPMDNDIMPRAIKKLTREREGIPCPEVFSLGRGSASPCRSAQRVADAD